VPLSLALLCFVAAGDPAPSATPPPKPVEGSEKDLIERDDYAPRLSLPTEEDWELWRHDGLRVLIGYGYTSATGAGTALSYTGHTLFLRPQMRLDTWWTLGLDFNFVIATGHPSGLAVTALVEPVFHPIDGLSIAIGIGYATVDLVGTFLPGGFPESETSRDVPASVEFPACDGTGVAATARIDYLFVVGPLFASGPFVSASAQSVKCDLRAGNIDGETGEPVELHQEWRHRGFGLGWTLAWR
jgi:hypothetical protein